MSSRCPASRTIRVSSDEAIEDAVHDLVANLTGAVADSRLTVKGGGGLRQTGRGDRLRGSGEGLVHSRVSGPSDVCNPINESTRSVT